MLYELIKDNVHTHIASTQDFLKRLPSMELTPSSRFASLDVVNLYGSIPIEDGFFSSALSTVSEFFQTHKARTCLAELTNDDFCALLKLCLTADTVQVDSLRYKQVLGLQMGNNLSTSVAIIFMFSIETQIFELLPNNIKTWVRYIDDVFLIYENITTTELVAVCNDVHPHISFTIEEPTNSSLPYLDLLVTAKDSHLTTTLHSKPMHSGSVIPWTSHHPRRFLLSVLRNELKRAIRNGTGPEEEEKGIQLLRTRYLNYGYPPRIISKILNQIRSGQNKQRSIEPGKPVFLSIPFVSERQVREVRSAIRRCGMSNNLRVCFKSRTLSSILCPRRERACIFVNCKYCFSSMHDEDCFTKCCVYFVECVICKASYVGETFRTVRSRLREHVSCETSLVFQHLRIHTANPDLNAIRWTIAHRGLRNQELRRKIEAAEIRSRRPSINVVNCPT